ncbi:MAG: DUF2110 family protein [Candidatus Bathyarchaeota archaeon]|nr:DUF2110 family protein [Candidatus Bathyarchaeota archaeon]
MTELTLLTKIYNSHQLKQIDKTLSGLLGDLSVKATVGGTLAGKWVQLEVSGEDEAIATKLLERETGFCPVSLENVKKFAVLKGFVTNLDPVKQELLVDIGVLQPKTTYAAISLKRLQSQLADGKEMPLRKLAELWGISENLPLEIKVLQVNAEENRVEAELHQGQVKEFLSWKESLLDRLLILGASRLEVDAAVRQERLDRDIIEVEELSMFEHALVCKLGTDATGLIGRIGRRLRKTKFTVFNPKKTRTILKPA